MSDPKRPKTEAGVEADEKEKRRLEDVNNTFDRRYKYLYNVSPINKEGNYKDYFDRLRALSMGINPVLSPADLEQFQEEIDFFMRRGYGGYLAVEDIYPPDKEYFLKYVEDAKAIQALAQKAFEAARRRTNQKYEAVFEDDDKEEAGDVVYGPGGIVMGKGKPNHHMSRGDEYHKGCNRVY